MCYELKDNPGICLNTKDSYYTEMYMTVRCAICSPAHNLNVQNRPHFPLEQKNTAQVHRLHRSISNRLRGYKTCCIAAYCYELMICLRFVLHNPICGVLIDISRVGLVNWEFIKTYMSLA